MIYRDLKTILEDISSYSTEQKIEAIGRLTNEMETYTKNPIELELFSLLTKNLCSSNSRSKRSLNKKKCLNVDDIEIIKKKKEIEEARKKIEETRKKEIEETRKKIEKKIKRSKSLF